MCVNFDKKNVFRIFSEKQIFAHFFQYKTWFGLARSLVWFGNWLGSHLAGLAVLERLPQQHRLLLLGLHLQLQPPQSLYQSQK